MTREEIIAYQAKLKAWRETEIGQLFEKYDSAIGNAWVTDQTSNSTSRMKEAWNKAGSAKKAFLDKLTELTGVKHPYT